MTSDLSLTQAVLEEWTDGRRDDVALCLKQELLSVEGNENSIIFPPTYAGIGYNIDALSDGTRVATIDSVGSQANRIEPIFKSKQENGEEEKNPFAALVPQIEIAIRVEPKGGDPYTVKRSILDLAHRSADATVYACPTLGPEIKKAFHALKTAHDAWPICRLAPTSLVFGVWDSRGGSGEKHPRLVRSIIRAWDVEPLHAAAQFNSIRKTLDEEKLSELEKTAKANNRKLSDVGLDDAPATFRKADKIPEYKDGSPNPERRVLGGVLARGPIQRDVTVNLVALRRLQGKDQKETREIRRYLLSLALIAATADFELYLREGCHLRFAGKDQWFAIPRRGDPNPVDLASPEAGEVIREYAKEAAQPFRQSWPETLIHEFDLSAAKRLIATAEVEEEGGS